MYTLYLYTDIKELKELYYKKMMEPSRNGDAGVDLYVPETFTFVASKNDMPIFLDHQVVCRMTKMTQENEVPVSYYLYPRSSMSKTPFRLANSVGIIDAGYRGNIIAALDYRGNDEYTLEMGQRLVQICTPTLEPIRLVVCDAKEEMDMNTSRAAGGFGSTGK
jgi:dUTP pyrophosphatase